MVSIRRRVLPDADMKLIRDHVQVGQAGRRYPDGQPRVLTGALTKSRRKDSWTGRKFDADVFGGNYHGHHGNKLTVDGDRDWVITSILNGVSKKKRRQTGWFAVHDRAAEAGDNGPDDGNGGGRSHGNR